MPNLCFHGLGTKGDNKMVAETFLKRGETCTSIACVGLSFVSNYHCCKQGVTSMQACLCSLLFCTKSASTSRRNVIDLRKMQNSISVLLLVDFPFRSSLFEYGDTFSSLDRNNGIERHRIELTKLSRVQGCCRSLQSHPTSQSCHATLIDLFMDVRQT